MKMDILNGKKIKYSSDKECLNRSLRQIRNNFIPCGKYPEGPETEIARK